MNWLTYSPTSGHGNTQITLSASTLTGLEDRIATLIATGSQEGQTLSATTVITQKYLTLTEIYFENLTWSTDVAWSGGTATSANCSFSIIAKYSDNSTEDITNLANVTGSLFVPFSGERERHSAGTLTLTATYEDKTCYGNTVAYQEAFDFSQEPLTFNISSGGIIVWETTNSSVFRTIDYKLNNGNWVSITSNTGASAPTITVNAGDKIQFRGNNTAYGDGTSSYSTFSSSTAEFEVEGNIMSLINKTDFVTATTLENANTFAWLFRGCTGLTSAENLILPATTLTKRCYSVMFGGCTSLATAPVLPATTLAEGCYNSMFNGCSSLTTAPALPATTLAYGCYTNMFVGCTSLTTVPSLPATTLAQACYEHMFDNCASLTAVPSNYLPVTALTYGCYSGMFYGCSSLTTAPALPATTLVNYCYSEMFMGCTSLTTAPVLPATTLAYSCYHEMFYGTNVLPDCSNIDFASSTVVASGGLIGLFAGTKVTDNDLERLLPKNDNGRYYLPITTLADSCYQEMFYKCASLTTAPVLPATTLANSCYFGMFSNCAKLTTAPALPATNLADSCYSSMFNGCTSLTTAPVLPATTLTNSCYGAMFGGCTSLTTAPELPATTLADYCYEYMFDGCSSLSYIKCLATDISAYRCRDYWVRGVAATGTFVKNPKMVSWGTGDSGIPEGWTVVNNS